MVELDTERRRQREKGNHLRTMKREATKNINFSQGDRFLHKAKKETSKGLMCVFFGG